MQIQFNGELIDVNIPEGYIPTDAVLIIRSQSMESAAVEHLAVSATPHTGGMLQHGMISLAADPAVYDPAYDEDDD